MAFLQVNGVDLLSDMAVMKEYGQQVHQEVLGLIAALSDDKSSDGGSFVSQSIIAFYHPDYVLVNHKCLFQLPTQVFTSANTPDSFLYFEA
jgi:hypothetical protein